MKRNPFALLRIHLFVALASMLFFSLLSCEPDEGVGGDGNRDPSQNFTDIAVTGAVDAYGSRYADIIGYANLNLLTASSGNVMFGVELIVADAEDNSSVRQETSTSLEGNKFMVSFKSLIPATKYEYRSFVTCGGITYYGEYRMFTTKKVVDDVHVAEAVDLGLSVMWASFNVGAESPEDYGGYYAWGETEEKSAYSWSTYKWCNGGYDNLFKYCARNNYGTIDNKTKLDFEDDVAHVKWGGSWRMPTFDEIKELCYKCSWEWTTVNGVKGQKITGSNGNSIFLPAAGVFRDTEVYGSGIGYWSSTLGTQDNSTASCVVSDVSDVAYRCYGLSVRPVMEYSNVAVSVDLGLSVKWANWNVGAKSEEDYGDYFAWGEVEEKTIYSWSTYKWYNDSDDSMTKYCADGNFGIVDNKKTLDPEDDVAHIKWGDDWRMPTSKEFKELYDSCTWMWTSINGINGYRVVASNDNSIFLPVAGGLGGEYDNTRGRYGYYWSSTLYDNDDDDAYIFWFEKGTWGWNYIGHRKQGFSVRPVIENGNFDSAFDAVITGSVDVCKDRYVEITSYANSHLLAMHGGNAVFGVEVIMADAENNSSARKRKTGSLVENKFTVSFENLVPSTKYKYRSYVTYGDITYYGEYSTFTTEDVAILEAVDLGLSVKWANWNVGADSPEDYGDYYAWGEIKVKSAYSWSTYKWCDGSFYTQTKYCTNSGYGVVDDKKVLSLEDDVAHVKWGGSWRMPTLDEIKELCNKCSWKWTTVNSVRGYNVTGPNGNSIFLPAAGERYGSYVNNGGSYGYYWSATLESGNNDCAYFLSFHDGYYDWSSSFRYRGCTIRPVTE